ncbi:NADPH:quinone oxidoreductase family protein [Siccirubricoccus sp. KC 17139]|uniref:NADPH:quinone oxidoreductase family protein n=1 Tax=Siccirubricoccus soli TaxID=2899147 RepID=A0ABT1D001_9PROT|nr:NADPH:quinone oxidoreductase family protein [Siccirubricoccus soli]MCO6415219.1 NADPH:quinone oxidoreductase family protein [Siccirubricoccus soli]MCP2681350.1 NADPH:quinone oxidoreductase family protein [Siccirubricoccus soli]
MPKAVLCRVLEGPAALRLEEVPPAGPPGPSEVRVRIHAAGLNFPDLLMAAGRYQFKPPLPFALGREAAGVVDAVGSGVTRCRTGDRVLLNLSHGAFAEEIVAPEHTVRLIPAPFTFAEAACFHVATATATNALLQRGQLAPGEMLLVHGAGGGVGLAAVEVGKLLGATVIAVAGGAEKLAVATAHGADHAIDHSREDFRERVREITEGRGADVVFDPVGGNTFDTSLRCMAFGGRILIVGFAGGRIQQIPGNQPLLKCISVVGVQALTHAERDPAVGEAYERWMYGHAAQGRLRPHISHSLPMARFAEALDLLASRQAIGRVALTMQN